MAAEAPAAGQLPATKFAFWLDTYAFEGAATVLALAKAPVAPAKAPAPADVKAKPAAADAKPKGGGGGGGKSASKADVKGKDKGKSDGAAASAAASTAPAAEPKPAAADAKAAPAPAPVRWALVLDTTLFHPQGGGQPSDVGVIALAGAAAGAGAHEFVVEAVSKDERGVITHTGVFRAAGAGAGGSANDSAPACWAVGAGVALRVDAATRKNHARLHSAGHLIDIAVAWLDVGLSAGKGNHAPGNAYVEYSGALSDAAKDTFVTKLQGVVDALIAADHKLNVAQSVPYDEIGACCGGVTPSYMPAGKPARIVTIAAPRTAADGKVAAGAQMAPGCPCGGTHVRSTRALASLSIRKVEKKGKAWRVKYEFTNAECPV